MGWYRTVTLLRALARRETKRVTEASVLVVDFLRPSPHRTSSAWEWCSSHHIPLRMVWQRHLSQNLEKRESIQ